MANRQTSARTPHTASRGRIDKREAILEAALDNFARDGYRQSSVDAIAADAGVAKHTIYNHFTDKQNLLREVVATESDRSYELNMAAVLQLQGSKGDLRSPLEQVGIRLLECYCDPRSAAIRRLLYAEMQTMTDLIDIAHSRAFGPVTEALADRLARFALSGELDLTDAAGAGEAAEQLIALLIGPMENRTRMGTRAVTATELRGVAHRAVRTFLKAYATTSSTK
ncbi:TetR/AcrR family transcriptional regulator [Nocardia salmonicida]|uniref:TetR/AcrR family transcriptional regulator n=1 Tax=Nocardia salmonicida TaxID=53431 RepID=UPI00362E2369